MSFYPEDFRFNIYVLWAFKQRTERFSEDKYKIAAYIIVFSLRAFCCIIYDGQISPEVSELPCMRVMVDLNMIWRTTKRILKLEQICKTSLEYFALAVGFLSIIFSDSMGEMLKNRTEEGYSGIYVCTKFFRNEELLLFFVWLIC